MTLHSNASNTQPPITGLTLDPDTFATMVLNRLPDKNCSPEQAKSIAVILKAQILETAFGVTDFKN